jgi:hypothetical protein
MKQAIAWVGMAAVLLCAGAAQAWEESFRAASGDIVAGVGATKIYESTLQQTVLRCSPTGCQFQLHGFIPSDATSPNITVRWNLTTPDSIVSITPHTQVCGLVVKQTAAGDQVSANFNNFTCAAASGATITAQWQMQAASIFGLTLPTLVNGNIKQSCTMTPIGGGVISAPPNCNGGDLYINVFLVNDNPDNIDYTMFTVSGS